MTQTTGDITRARTAIHRAELSRPLRTGISDGIINVQSTIFDYGCGHGDDVRQLVAQGYAAKGWDPILSASGDRTL